MHCPFHPFINIPSSFIFQAQATLIAWLYTWNHLLILGWHWSADMISGFQMKTDLLKCSKKTSVIKIFSYLVKFVFAQRSHSIQFYIWIGHLVCPFPTLKMTFLQLEKWWIDDSRTIIKPAYNYLKSHLFCVTFWWIFSGIQNLKDMSFKSPFFQNLSDHFHKHSNCLDTQKIL